MQAVEIVRARAGAAPVPVALVLGSGLGHLAGAVDQDAEGLIEGIIGFTLDAKIGKTVRIDSGVAVNVPIDGRYPAAAGPPDTQQRGEHQQQRAASHRPVAGVCR